jgi:hypothetical protein
MNPSEFASTFSRMTQMDPNVRQQNLFSALQQWPSNPDAALNIVRPMGETGDLEAATIAAYILAQQGRWQEGLPLARVAVEAGAAFLANNYASNMINSPQRRDALPLLRRLVESGWAIDPMGYAQQAAQAGDGTTAVEIVEIARSFPPHLTQSEERWQRLIQRVESAESDMAASVGAAKEASANAVQAIESETRSVHEAKERAVALVEEVTGLVHDVTADHLATEYATQAARMNRTAAWWTAGSIGASLGAIAFAVVVAVVVLKGAHSASSTLAKFSLTLPLVAFAAYLGGLASSHRRMAWHWRHVELQIRTAEPFIATLEDEERKALLAVLALRLFPGQTLDPHGKSEEGVTVDLTAIIGDFLRGRSGTA